MSRFGPESITSRTHTNGAATTALNLLYQGRTARPNFNVITDAQHRQVGHCKPNSVQKDQHQRDSVVSCRSRQVETRVTDHSEECVAVAILLHLISFTKGVLLLHRQLATLQIQNQEPAFTALLVPSCLLPFGRIRTGATRAVSQNSHVRVLSSESSERMTGGQIKYCSSIAKQEGDGVGPSVRRANTRIRGGPLCVDVSV